MTTPQNHSSNQPNYPNAGAAIVAEPKGGSGKGYFGLADYPLVAPDKPAAGGASTVEKQSKSGYSPLRDAPLCQQGPELCTVVLGRRFDADTIEAPTPN